MADSLKVDPVDMSQTWSTGQGEPAPENKRPTSAVPCRRSDKVPHLGALNQEAACQRGIEDTATASRSYDTEIARLSVAGTTIWRG